MRKPTLSQLMAALLVLERIHSTLTEWVPSYSDMTDNLVKKINKKLGFSQTLRSKVELFLGSNDISEVYAKTDHAILDGEVWKYLHKHLKIERVLHPKHGGELIEACQVESMEAVPMSEFEIAETDSVIVRKFQDIPECVEQKNDEMGLCPYTLTFAYYENKPVVLQLRHVDEDDTRNYTIIDLLVNPNDRELFDKLSKKLKTYVRDHSPIKGWVVSCEEDEFSYLTFNYDQDLCKKLRHEKYSFDPELYSIDAQNLIQRDIKNFIVKQDKFCSSGKDGRRAYLLEGPPGTGKSDIIKSIISIMPSNYTIIVLNDKNVNELRSLKRMKFLFPALVVIEDIDLLITSKSKWQILLNFLDGFHAPDKIITIMTSNNPKTLLSSITNRPGRIDRTIHIGPGNETQRLAQLRSLTKEIEMPIEISLNALALKTEGYTVADLRELIRRSVIYTEESTDGTTKISKEAMEEVLAEFDRQKSEKKQNVDIEILSDNHDEIEIPRSRGRRK